MPVDAAACAAANDYLRNVLGPNLTAADKRSMAEEFGVSLRTVQRWTTSAGQQRSFCSPSTPPDPDDATVSQAERRLDWLSYLSGRANDTVSTTPEEVFNSRPFSTIDDAERWAREAQSGDLDPWLGSQWRAMRLTNVDGVWYIQVEYERAYFDLAGAA